MKKLIYLLICGLFLTLSSCGGDDESDVIIVAKTMNYKDYYKAGEKIIFKIESFANEGFISSIDIYTINSYGITTLMDTVIDAERTEFMYQYLVTQFDTYSTNIKFYFKVTCSTGNYSEMSVSHYIDSGTHLETTEHTMFAYYKNEKNGFSIDRNEIVDVETDSLFVDIYDYSMDSTLFLSREWRSMTGLMFARFNDFDFENASFTSVVNAYTTSNKTSKLTNIGNEDIILVGKEYGALGVIKVINVFDEFDNMQDRYYFVFKGIYK